MADPGVGTIVVVHVASGYELPGIVTCTHTSWTEALGEDLGPETQPDEGTVCVVQINTDGTTNPDTISATPTDEASYYTLIPSEAPDE